jgi:hypothetical protein
MTHALRKTSMNVADAEREVVSEWYRWKSANFATDVTLTGTDGLMFFTHLQRNKPYLLDFRYGGDKWQRVHGWLLRRRFVND